MMDSVYDDTYASASVDGDAGDVVRDTRVTWMQRQLAALLRSSSPAGGGGDAVTTLAESPEFKDAASSLIGGFSRSLLVAEVGKRKGLLVVDPGTKSTVADAGWSRAAYFVKALPGAVTHANIDKEVLVGTLAPDPLADLEVATRAVFLPLVASARVEWSEVVSREVVDGMHNLLAQVAITMGSTRGTTRLPLPHSLSTGRATVSLDRVHVYEGCVVTWTKQIKQVLRLDPESMSTALPTTAHPEPLSELDFWEAKAQNLNSIFSQLQGDTIRRMLRALDQAKSTYAASFGKLCREVFAARAEANDNVMFLAPLRPWFELLEASDSFLSSVQLFRPLLHAVLNVWKYSRFYNTPTRLVVLMREVCNCLVRCATEYVSAERIFHYVEEGEPQQPVEMLMSTLRVCGIFKSTYFDYKARAALECRDNPWRVQNSALFSRLDRFLERCHDLRDFCQSILDFSRLAHLEIGGTKGKTLTTSIQQIYADFNSAVALFKTASYDVMDVDAERFDNDYYAFRNTVKELERRLGSVLTQGFEDAPTTTGRFKLLDSFEALLERPIVAEELERKHLDLLTSYGEDISRVQAMFLEGRDAPPIPPNMPPCAGALTWARGLLARVQLPMEKLRHLNRALLDREEARSLVKTYTSLVATLADYEHTRAEEWGRNVEAASSTTLKKCLLTHDDDHPRLLRVNFDPALVRLLREVKYFLLLGLSVPQAALSVYKRAETFRKHTGNLELIVNMYNGTLGTMKSVEQPLLTSYIQNADRALAPGLHTLNWKSHGIDLYISESMNVVRHAKEILDGMTHNLTTVKRMLATWSDAPMMQRNKSKPLTVSVLDPQVRATVQLRNQQLISEGRTVVKLVKDSNRKVKVSQGQSEWKAYVDYVNNVVVYGLLRVTQTSLTYLTHQLDPVSIEAEAKPPLIEVALDLVGKEVKFQPDLGFTPTRDGLKDTVMSWVDAFIRVGALFPRLDGQLGNYTRELQSDPHTMTLLCMINEHLGAVERDAATFRKLFLQYEPLWTEDIQTEFATFLETAQRSVFDEPEGEDEHDGDTPTFVRRRRALAATAAANAVAAATHTTGKAPIHSSPSTTPHAGAAVHEEDDGEGVVLGIKLGMRLDLDAVRQRIDWYKGLQAEVTELRHAKDIGFLRINSQPIKQALGTWVTKWTYQYTSFLADFMAGRLMWLQAFIEDVIEDGLTTDVSLDTAAGKERLMQVVRNIRRVRMVQERTALMFAPLQDTVDLLRHYDHNIQDTVIADMPLPTYLQSAQMRWDAAVNHMYKVKEAIQGPQFALAEETRGAVSDFRTRVLRFRDDFTVHGPFTSGNKFTPERAYAALDTYHRDLAALDAEAARLADLEELFELPAAHHTALADTRSDLGLLKQAWDMVTLVDTTIEVWQNTLWVEINAEDMLTSTKALQAQAAAMPGKLRTWPVFQSLTQRIKQLGIVLPLVQELRSPAVRDRHWTSLMLVTRVTVDKGPDFKLADVLRMNLHTHVAEVQEVLETAQKDLKTEMKLRTIEEYWSSTQFRFERYKDTDVQVLNPPDTLMTDLEDHMLSLQGVLSLGRFAEFFKARAVEWQETLSTVENTLRLWLTVQSRWMSLESIFMGSVDIRSSLPDDAKRFEGIDTDFKELSRDAETDPSVVTACTMPGRAERLQALSGQLEVCEKALTEYLDFKKNQFPRFYFLSNPAVLDILANSNNPPAVMPHLGSCFEALADLRLAPGPSNPDADVPTDADTGAPLPPVKDRATALVAKDGEAIQLDRHFHLQGPVESWLNDVVAVMRSTLRGLMDAALDAATGWEADQPRETWVYSYPAQVVQVAALVYWTEEAEAALEEFEGGAEDALRQYRDVCTGRLHRLVQQVQGAVNNEVRTKIISLITLDVHCRDVMADMFKRRVQGPTEFAWQSQLRCFHSDSSGDITVRVCDFNILYNYEYVGNSGRLVITPLTDRCYITLTMAMRLTLGGAPAGPAGTGKTETTKDLAKALGLPCYVFNCSDQMTYITVAEILKGLSQTGAWGCFDEFNRIAVEVLSVVATQITCILDAVRLLSVPENRREIYRSLPEGRPPFVVGSFTFEGDTLSLVPSVGLFITMNPGYAGRTELPENLKALFRPCAMIRPDVALICENMLMAEGFVDARMLSSKIVTLYKLSAELLSTQKHYDWGLRAIKSVLRIAGALKRDSAASGKTDETAVLLQALRDSNVSKLVAHDIPLFLGVMNDLSPREDTDGVSDEDMADRCRVACSQLNLQPSPGFVTKVAQLENLLFVRHSVMLLGPAASGKSTIWKTLLASYNMGQPKPVAVAEVMNPKSLTPEELYGSMSLARDWVDGVLSIVMRKMTTNTLPYSANHIHKWIVLDGDIDADWIESMNSLMDDNKTLTLVSNERLPLSPSMRLLFEIASLDNATPATVSRAGMLFVNETDVPWQALVDSWVSQRHGGDKASAKLRALFDKYVTPMLAEMSELNLVPETGCPERVMVLSLLRLLDCALALSRSDVQAWAAGTLTSLTPSSGGAAADAPLLGTSEQVEAMFVFCAVWALGGALPSSGPVDQRHRFSQLWTDTFTTVKFPARTSVFNAFFVPTPLAPSVPEESATTTREDLAGAVSYITWDSVVPSASISSGDTTHAVLVPTVSTVRLRFLLQMLAGGEVPVLLSGQAGTGKTVVVKDFLTHGLSESTRSQVINLNYFSDAPALQRQLEENLEKRSGRRFGPSNNSNMLVFVDDLNLPYMEEYGTQTPIALLRQWIDNGGWYDRGDHSVYKVICDTNIVAAMNPSAGSFSINPRLQRHFVTFYVDMPSSEDMTTIFGTLIRGHFGSQFLTSVWARVSDIVSATVEFGTLVATQFLPSASHPHYFFNLRHQAAVVQGLCLSSPSVINSEVQLVRLWLHECRRVYGDRMASEKDLLRFEQLLTDQSKRYFELPTEALHEEPNLFVPFALADGAGHVDEHADSVYVPCKSTEVLRTTLYHHLTEYNKTGTIMDLVLFEHAACHVARIARILQLSRGSALLMGVGGSGKQSLARLAAFVCGYSVTTPPASPTFSVHDLRDLLKDVYFQAGAKPAVPLVLLMTDSHILDERFLVYINDLLSSGVSADLYTTEELDSVVASVRNRARTLGIPDNRSSVLQFFEGRVRTNVHIVLCFSPVGEAFKDRARRFPALTSGTSMDWFHPWPRDALISVAASFLEEAELGTAAVADNLPFHMAEVHVSIAEAAVEYRKRFRSDVCSTPKSYLELIDSFKHLLATKQATMAQQEERLNTGLSTLERTRSEVSTLEASLRDTLSRVEDKKAATEDLLQQMGRERGEATNQHNLAAKEQNRADKAARAAADLETEAQSALESARPALEAAKRAVDCLDKPSLTELKAMQKPPAGVDLVTKAVLIMLNNEKKNLSWEAGKRLMANVSHFKTRLENYRGDLMPDDTETHVRVITNDPIFTPENMAVKSVAAANLCTWVINMMEYKRIYVKVAPLMADLEQAQRSKEAADAALQEVQAKVAAVEARLDELQAAFLTATNEKAAVEAEAGVCSARLTLAQRLVAGLASERQRWENDLSRLTEQKETVVGDSMLAAAFISYAGAFNSTFRTELWKHVWRQDLQQRDILITEDVDPVDVLVDGASIAQWQNDGLPHDRFSTENGSILMSARRWPLLIDPQRQGLKWLLAHHKRLAGTPDGQQLVVLRTSQRDWLRRLKASITAGDVVVLENIDERLDPSLSGVLARAVRRSGRLLYVTVGDDAVEYDPEFRLYLQTRHPSPRFRPEVQAQCTLLNFVVTPEGLEEQLLALVVRKEMPELEAKKESLQRSSAESKIKLLELETVMLESLANAPPDILSDEALIDSFEASKTLTATINDTVAAAAVTEREVADARNVFRPVAAEGSLLFFTVSQLSTVSHMYQYSLRSFIEVFFKGIGRAPEVAFEERVQALVQSVRLTVYNWVARGLLERHKLVMLSHMLLQLMAAGVVGEDTGYSPETANFLLSPIPPPSVHTAPSVTWLAPKAWVALQLLVELPAFKSLLSDLRANESRFKEWYHLVSPEKEKLPLDWRELDKTPFLKLLVVRALRPDRINAALTRFVETVLPNGHEFVSGDSQLNSFQILAASFEDSSPTSPVYFLLSPGSDIGPDMERLAREQGMVKGSTYHEISLGQGQDKVAEEVIVAAQSSGHWVLLNNAHLMPRWLTVLDKMLDATGVPPHANFRLFLSSEPSDEIPIGLLGRCMKLTNEPPTGLQANLKRAFRTFSGRQVDDLDMRTRGVLFGLCHFHAIMTERLRFGAVGFNRHYPFSSSDLLAASAVLRNYMEYSPRMPWEDLRYLFGEIVYGGHIVNDFDRLLCNTYLEFFLTDELLDEMELFPFLPDGERVSFRAPAPTSFDKYVEVIDTSTSLASNTPLAFGLHPNAEIGYRTEEAESLFTFLIELQPRSRDVDGDLEAQEYIADGMCQDLLEEFRDVYLDMSRLDRRMSDDPSPFSVVFYQECKQMNVLVEEMIRTLSELEQGLRGELQLSVAMEELVADLCADRVPASWARCAYPSLRALAGWLRDLRHRWQQLLEWTENPDDIPAVTWIGGLFKPQSFLTAVLQTTAQQDALELDKLMVSTELLRKDPDELTQPAREGAYITGLYLEGARWNLSAMRLEECRAKELFCALPVVHCKAVVASKFRAGVMVPIPVYRTQSRGDTYIFTARLRSKEEHTKWVLAGVVLVMEIK